MLFLVIVFTCIVPEATLTSPAVKVRPIIPLENLTISWAYYNKYLRQHVAHLIDALPFSLATQNGDRHDVMTPKDIRKGISEALDLMPFANRTAFELELERLRAEASGVVTLKEPDRLTNETLKIVHSSSSDRNSSNVTDLDVQQGWFETFQKIKIPYQ